MQSKELTRLEAVPSQGIERAVEIMQSGKLFRYSDDSPEKCEAALFERDFAEYLGVRYALAVSSCTQALELAMIACDVKAGDKVLVPGFTFTAVPSSIVILGAVPVFIECNDDFRLNLDDLRRKISDDTKVLLLSHMRGHMSDIDAIVALCEEKGVTIIEDAAHALGANWGDRKVGSFGKVSGFSFQSNKIINAGEGGMLTTDDEEIIVKATYLSGSYEANYKKHFWKSPLFEAYAGRLPAHNVRMSNLTAAIARPQISLLDEKGRRYREMYAYLQNEIEAQTRIRFPRQHEQETRIPDSIQFRVPGCSDEQMQAFIQFAKSHGLPLSRFADPHNARAFYNWRYLGDSIPNLPQTKAAIQSVCDMRLSSTLNGEHLAYIVSTICAALREVDAGQRLAVNQ